MAYRAGVSRSTASRVVNGAAHVRAETRRSVERAIAELGYVTNTAAASLVTRRSGQVALVVCAASAASDAVFAGTVRGATTELSAAGMTCLLTVYGTDDDPVRLTRTLRTVGVDGVIVVADDGLRRPLCQRLRAVEIPTVAVGARPASADGAQHNARAGARRMVGRLR
ncbi:MAG TPA: LacI family DNA-binding transcriptional regulator [Pilimelia sp.]|nr:LacI family DNA-binding transcriptional regulator [Pilimelia sp.]